MASLVSGIKNEEMGTVRYFRTIILLLVGVVFGLFIYGGAEYGYRLYLENTVLQTAVTFVRAEHGNDQEVLLKLTTEPILSEIKNGSFPYSKPWGGKRMYDEKVIQLCQDRAKVLLKVLPSDDDRYVIESLSLVNVNGNWLIESVQYDR